MITKENIQTIMAAIAQARQNYPSDAKHAASLEMTPAQYSAIKNGNVDRQLSEGAWIRIARKLGVQMGSVMPWKAAKTATYEYVTTQLEACQKRGLSSLLCDIPNIGKTFAAKQYVKSHRNAVYIDCSQTKTKMRLIRKIASEFGIDTHGIYSEVYDYLTYYLRSIETPIVILDEAGDLDYAAFLELKALWNATEHSCGWYMMGANGLRAKIDRLMEVNKVGYEEIFSRYGGRFGRVTPEDAKERQHFVIEQAYQVATANAPKGADTKVIARKSAGGLRRVFTEIEKLSTND